MKNTVTLSKNDLEKVKTDMFYAGYAAGAAKLDLSEKDLLEISLNLTRAAKIVEKTNPKLADWLKFVNRKAIALVNKEK
jgi:hypothetical protein